MTELLTDEPDDDSRGRFRDLAAMLALPAMWVDHEPAEIAVGLLGVLAGVLRLDGAYARFDDPRGGAPLERWRPVGPSAPVELRIERAPGQGARRPNVTTGRGNAPPRLVRVAEVLSTLPGEPGFVRVSAGRSGFPTDAEIRILRAAVNQAAIAIHTARRIAQERAARTVAEAALARQTRLLRALAEEVEPSLAVVSGRIREAADLDPRMPDGARAASARGPAPEADGITAAMPVLLPLTHREVEVLGLLAQGLSNKEIAGVLWLSDRTVERHITGLYRKIGVARRSEATAFALRHGVV